MKPILYETLQRFAVQERPQVYLEIGVREGDSLKAVLDVHTPEMLLLCDNWSGEYGGSARGSNEHIIRLLQNLKYDYSVLFYDGDSQITVPTIKPIPDMALIDGDHSFKGCEADMYNVWQLLPVNGLMIVDDLSHPAHTYLQDVVSYFIAQHLCKVEFTSLDRQGVAVIRKI
jgi:hypothetical protein